MNAEQEIFNAYKQVLSEKTNKQDLPGVNIIGNGGYNNSKAADLEDQGGPGNVEGVQKPEEVDLSQKSFNQYNKMQKKSKKSKKVCESAINKNMNKTKSSFDKLFEDAMSDNSDLEDLGIENSTEAGDDTGDSVDFNVGGGDGDEVTVTLDRATAQALHDVLMAALEGGSDEGDDMEMEGDDMEGDDMGGEDEDEDVMPEATEMEELSKTAGHDLTGLKKYKEVGDEKVKPASGKANSGKIPAVDTGSAGPKYKQGAQKVEGSHLKPGASFFKS